MLWLSSALSFPHRVGRSNRQAPFQTSLADRQQFLLFLAVGLVFCFHGAALGGFFISVHQAFGIHDFIRDVAVGAIFLLQLLFEKFRHCSPLTLTLSQKNLPMSNSRTFK